MVNHQNEVDVMVIDDEQNIRTYMVEILEFEGFKAAGFANGLEALNYLAHAELPSLIILDMRMTVMDGPQFRAAMLKNARLAKIPVIVVTAFEPAKAEGMAAVRVFRKPIDVDALVGAVRALC